MRKASTLWLSCLLLMATLVLKGSANYSGLKVGYYHKSCPSAESTVKEVVDASLKKYPGFGAGLIRMHFHDCFVRGCDASILLESTPGKPAEKESIANNPSLRGFEVIYEAKKKLEKLCPKTVSCADILTFAARDSVNFTSEGKISYQVPSGRLDGRVSNESEVLENLAGPSFNASSLIANFASKGLSAEDLVLLSGAHSIGISHCTSFARRLYNFTGKGDQDPSLDPDYAKRLKKECPPPKVGENVVDQDFVTPNILDNEYYENLKKHKVLFTSDETLLHDKRTYGLVKANAENGKEWGVKFAKAMVKMGGLKGVPNRRSGEVRLLLEIREDCTKVNY